MIAKAKSDNFPVTQWYFTWFSSIAAISFICLYNWHYFYVSVSVLYIFMFVCCSCCCSHLPHPLTPLPLLLLRLFLLSNLVVVSLFVFATISASFFTLHTRAILLLLLLLPFSLASRIEADRNVVCMWSKFQESVLFVSPLFSLSSVTLSLISLIASHLLCYMNKCRMLDGGKHNLYTNNGTSILCFW